MNEGRNLTSEEIENLSLELKICFFLLGWNTRAEINSVEDWIDNFWSLWPSQYEDELLFSSEKWEEEARSRMKTEFEKIYSFILYVNGENPEFFKEGE